MGLDILIYDIFTRDIAAWSRKSLWRRYWFKQLHVAGGFCRFNYSFCHKGLGTPQLLAEMGQAAGFAVNIIEPVMEDGEIVSSSAIRKALETGNIDTAFKMLGYHPIIQGMVIEGEHRGAAIGFPTANIGVESLL
jgi:riboflavin kinase/FMN adenylyltransferase